jgi:uncharacterized surface protein with fasciclin (FAS1) repeats
MSKLSRLNKRPMLSCLLRDEAQPQSEEKHKYWQERETNEMSDITAKLSKLGYKITKYFGIYKLDGSECKFVLATSSQNHEVIIEVEEVKQDNLIVVEGIEVQLLPAAICETFVEFNANTRTSSPSNVKVCVLSHLGIDLLGIEEKVNYQFSSPVRDVPTLSRGVKFFQALPFIKYKWLVDDVSNNTLYNYVNEDEDLSLFFALMSKSSNAKFLAAAGPYTVFAPSNFAFGKVGELDIDKLALKKRDEIFLRHVFLGNHDADHSGKITNLLGETFTLRDGRIISQNKAVKPSLKNLHKSNGTITIISEVLGAPDTQVNFDDKLDVIKVTINAEPLVSEKDIADLTYHLWKKQNEYDVKTRQSVKEQVEIILDRINRHEAEVGELEDVGQQLLELNERYNDYLHQSQVKIEDDRMSLRLSGEIDMKGDDLKVMKKQIAKLSGQYAEHIKSSSQLNALEKSLQSVAKNIRDL